MRARTEDLIQADFICSPFNSTVICKFLWDSHQTVGQMARKFTASAQIPAHWVAGIGERGKRGVGIIIRAKTRRVDRCDNEQGDDGDKDEEDENDCTGSWNTTITKKRRRSWQQRKKAGDGQWMGIVVSVDIYLYCNICRGIWVCMCLA